MIFIFQKDIHNISFHTLLNKIFLWPYEIENQMHYLQLFQECKKGENPISYKLYCKLIFFLVIEGII